MDGIDALFPCRTPQQLTSAVGSHISMYAHCGMGHLDNSRCKAYRTSSTCCFVSLYLLATPAHQPKARIPAPAGTLTHDCTPSHPVRLCHGPSSNSCKRCCATSLTAASTWLRYACCWHSKRKQQGSWSQNPPHLLGERPHTSHTSHLWSHICLNDR